MNIKTEIQPEAYNVKEDRWIRPWNRKHHDDILNRDDRFFSLVMKGALGWLTSNILLYDKTIRHFIFNTGSTYMYVESNGYEYDLNTVSGENYMYMERPRCNVEIENFSIPTEELSQPNVRCEYERKSSLDNTIKGYSAQFRRIPLEIQLNLHYTLSNFNEGLIIVEELISKMLFQKYFNITYLGQVIECSIEFPRDFKINVNKPDLASTDDNNNYIDLSIVVCTNYPAINERTEIPADKVIASFGSDIKLYEKESISDIHDFKVE